MTTKNNFRRNLRLVTSLVLTWAFSLTSFQSVSSMAATDRIYASSSSESSGFVKVSIRKSDLQALLSPTKSCNKSLAVYIEPLPGAIARSIEIEVFSSTYDQYDSLSNSVQSSQRVVFSFSNCGSASWRTLTWNVVLDMVIQSPATTNNGITTTVTSKVRYIVQQVALNPNRSLPTIKNVEILSSSKSANILVSSQERAADPPFTYEYKIVSPVSKNTNWTKVRGPVIGLTKLKSKMLYKIAVRPVSFDKVYGKTVFKQFSTK
jgi:hypothetical protein